MTDNSNNIVQFFIYTLSELEVLLYNDELFTSNNNIQAIQRNIKTFLYNNCNHDIEKDTIEIDYEKTQQITYCKKCMLN